MTPVAGQASETDRKLALPPGARRLLNDVQRLDTQLWEGMKKHARSHDDCAWSPILTTDRYCPVHSAMMDAWWAVRPLARALAWLLIGAPITESERKDWGI